MITYDEAFRRVMLYTQDFGEETVDLMSSQNRILAETIYADRDFPPFNRSTKDGIAINQSALEKGLRTFKIEGVISAGMPQQILQDSSNCLEIMTGAVLPENADTIIMYEDVDLKDGSATINADPKKGQNIHFKGSDKKEGTVLLDKGIQISASEIGILASVGKSEVLVKKLPKVCVISTGDELVPVDETPLSHQVRTSNVLSLKAALLEEKIDATHLHIYDDKKGIEERLKIATKHYDVLLLSGGVSKGKFDFIPEVLDELGVEKIFHKVLQRPGRPFWFGVHEEYKTVVFSFPGNPISTFSNYHVYFTPWLKNSLGLGVKDEFVELDNDTPMHPYLTLYVPVKTKFENGKLYAKTVENNGSGDLTCLAEVDGFVCLASRDTEYKEGELVPFIPSK
ncbi:molybdopterin molybdotransferase MoeA [Cellulophaga baltica]|uniref:molybdopterin molybdotransferase MoeA n=1 Tax=Cellulophaga TaxID=104264 RepID=UPI001C07A9EB|nr:MULTISPECIES: molybdopterin molybdotransferase MoeA [Cellulophaga]MBU2996517.1 molybdopterin molybdotransferase MoeA [Cellulophaga baltica]MDO6767911.1 molybdopterin molybdotransferase MoeA [Cellulophaga sp. 1_MG-2023]